MDGIVRRIENKLRPTANEMIKEKPSDIFGA